MKDHYSLEPFVCTVPDCKDIEPHLHSHTGLINKIEALDAKLIEAKAKLLDKDECIRSLRFDLEIERNLVENLRPSEQRALKAEATVVDLENKLAIGETRCHCCSYEH